jgi:hypothetical protein
MDHHFLKEKSAGTIAILLIDDRPEGLFSDDFKSGWQPSGRFS